MIKIKIIMYKQIKTSPVITLSSGTQTKPVATLEDEYGSICQIVEDDHCYVLKLKNNKGQYENTTHIFPEAFEVLKTLPNPE